MVAAMRSFALVAFLPPWTVALIVILLIVLVLLLLSFLLRDRLIAGLQYTREFSEEGVCQGEYVTLTETIVNPSFLPVFFVDVESNIYAGLRLDGVAYNPREPMQYVRSRFHLLPFMQVKRRHKVHCAVRGYYSLETVDISYNRRVRYLPALAKIYVYPAVVPVNETPSPISIRQGDSITLRRLITDPFSYSGIRPYRIGDPFASINFKATARSGILGIEGLRVNNREYSSSRTVLVCLNFQLSEEKPMPGRIYEAMMETGLSYAAALIRDALYLGYQAGYVSNGMTFDGDPLVYFPIDGGEPHLHEILRKMALTRLAVGASFTAILAEQMREGLTDTELYVLTPAMSEEAVALLEIFAERGNTVHLVDLRGGKIDEE